MLLSTALTAWPYDVSYDGIYYTLAERSDGTGIATVVNNGSFNTYSGNLVIPQSITHNDKVYTVTTIGYQALKNSTELTSVSLPNTIEYMSNEAFAGCTSLTTLTIPPSIFSVSRCLTSQQSSVVGVGFIRNHRVELVLLKHTLQSLLVAGVHLLEGHIHARNLSDTFHGSLLRIGEVIKYHNVIACILKLNYSM